MKVAVFSSHSYDRVFLRQANSASGGGYELQFFEARLTRNLAGLAANHDAICAFVNDQLGREVLEVLAASGTRLIALRSAGAITSTSKRRASSG